MNVFYFFLDFITSYLPIIIVLVIIILILLIIIVVLARRKRKDKSSSSADHDPDPYMKMDDIIQLRNENSTRNVRASLPPVPTSAVAVASNAQTESHYDSIDGGYVNAEALKNADEPNEFYLEDVSALKNSRA